MELTPLGPGHFFTEPFPSTRKRGELNAHLQSTQTSSRFLTARLSRRTKVQPRIMQMLRTISIAQGANYEGMRREGYFDLASHCRAFSNGVPAYGSGTPKLSSHLRGGVHC